MKRMWHIFAAAIVLVVSAWLLTGGLDKLLHMSQFQAAIHRHNVIPKSSVAVVGWVVAVMEIAAGSTALAIVVGASAVSRAAWVLGSVFVPLTLYALMLVVKPPPTAAPCGCGGFASGVVADWTTVVLRNGVMLAGLGLVAALGISRQSFQCSSRPELAK